MSKFAPSYPVKPFWVTQAWGIANPSYLQFGFDKHNGVDMMMGNDKRNYCPVKSFVEDAGYNDGAGNYVRLITTDRWNVGGVNCYVGMMVMHHEKLLCKTGDILEEGDVLGIADNTGFSTGPHTHISFYRLSKQKNINENRLDTDWHTNLTFDPFPYWSGKYAQDAKVQPVIPVSPNEAAIANYEKAKANINYVPPAEQSGMLAAWNKIIAWLKSNK